MAWIHPTWHTTQKWLLLDTGVKVGMDGEFGGGGKIKGTDHSITINQLCTFGEGSFTTQVGRRAGEWSGRGPSGRKDSQ